MADKRGAKRSKNDDETELNVSNKKSRESTDKTKNTEPKNDQTQISADPIPATSDSVVLRACALLDNNNERQARSRMRESFGIDGSNSVEDTTFSIELPLPMATRDVIMLVDSPNPSSKTSADFNESPTQDEDYIILDGTDSSSSTSDDLYNELPDPSILTPEVSQEESVKWACSECTFMNGNDLDFCEICETPKNHVELLKFELSQCHSLINELKGMVSNKGEAIKYPEHWSGGKDSKGVNRVDLPADHAEYKFVIDNGGSTLKKLIPNIMSIQRIENWAMYQVFAQKKETMIQKNGDTVTNERWLWHGSDQKALNNICNYGFNRSYSGKKATSFGSGVYFATHFNRSEKYSIRYWLPVTESSYTASAYTVLLCRVLTGHYTPGKPELIEAPLMESGGRYDSGVDKLDSPSIHVVFQDYQAYPEYEITLKEDRSVAFNEASAALTSLSSARLGKSLAHYRQQSTRHWVLAGPGVQPSAHHGQSSAPQGQYLSLHRRQTARRGSSKASLGLQSALHGLRSFGGLQSSLRGQLSTSQGQPSSVQGQSSADQRLKLYLQGLESALGIARGQPSAAQGQSSAGQWQPLTGQRQSSAAQGQSSAAQGQSSAAQGQSSAAKGQSSTAKGQSSAAQGQSSASQGQSPATQGQ